MIREIFHYLNASIQINLWKLIQQELDLNIG